MSTNGGLLAEGITVQDARNGRSPAKLLDIKPGSQASIGSCRACRLDVQLRSRPGFHIQLHAEDDGWSLSNHSSNMDILVEDLEDPLQRIVCRPRRQEAAMPFEMARIRAEGRSLLIVSASEPRFREEPACAEPGEEAKVGNETSVYFLATVLLCSARLQHGPDAPLITQREISRQLMKLGHVVGQRTVRSYLDYFADRLGIPAQDASPNRVRWWRRELLARTVVTNGIVRPEHLRLLQD